ncbi:MAG: hypothetical protein GF353_25400 [Candidatus Lokiarchaeota archaeon]|nr:hypothetical protein [Candidatus Lokiarchaeota archaeon]
MKVWAAVEDGWHNSNTDMTYWKGKFYLIHACSPYHFGINICKLKLWSSKNAKRWNFLRIFQIKGEDIRDPKFQVLDDKLVLYALKNKTFNPEPYDSVMSTSLDGDNWTEWSEISNQEGWLFWRPKTHDGNTWYVPVYWRDHGKSKLLKSKDGTSWNDWSVIYEGLKNDETAIEFFPDGRLLCTARLEGSGNFLGDQRGCTLISVTDKPYKNWKRKMSYLTRLDGPVLFSYDGKVYAVGRYQPKRGFMTKQGSIFARKRTSIFLIEEDRLVWLSDLPSAGDTTYGGVVLKDGYLYVCYYTNDVKKDFPWVLGMISQSDIMMAQINLQRLKHITPL